MSISNGTTIRSPSYPSLSLREAVDDVGKIERLYRSAPVDRENAAKLVGYGGLSGPANKALAALASYGLVERAGKGQMRVTKRAQAILHPKDEDERRENLRNAASEPRLFQALQDHFEGVIPPENGIITYLHRQGFNQSAIKPAAKAFLQTVEFLKEAGATESHGSKSEGGPESPMSNGDKATTYGGAKVGDLVQWDSQGSLQFPTPLRVRLVSDDGQWVAVEGSETGIPMNEIMVQTPAPEALGAKPPKFPLPMNQQEHEPEMGEEEWLRNKVGSDTHVRLLVKGEMGAREIGKLIKILEAQKSVLEDD